MCEGGWEGAEALAGAGTSGAEPSWSSPPVACPHLAAAAGRRGCCPGARPGCSWGPISEKGGGGGGGRWRWVVGEVQRRSMWGHAGSSTQGAALLAAGLWRCAPTSNSNRSPKKPWGGAGMRRAACVCAGGCQRAPCRCRRPSALAGGPQPAGFCTEACIAAPLRDLGAPRAREEGRPRGFVHRALLCVGRPTSLRTPLSEAAAVAESGRP